MGAAMDRLTTLADYSIRRACGFASLAIGTVMLSLSFDAVLCFRTGAVLFAFAAVVLWAMAQAAQSRNVRRTELWMLLDGRVDLPKARVQQVLGGVLRDRYLWHATAAAAVAAALWVLAALFALAR
jgi:type IV secretory pathway VirB3-like protein